MEIHSGYLTVKVPSVLKTKTYSNFWCILYSGRGNHSPRIDLHHENTKIAQTSCKKTILIEEAKWKKIESSEPACSFEVKHSKQYIFISASVSELELWILNLCCLSKELFDTKHVIGLADSQEMDIRNMTGDEDELVVKENFLYTSSSDLQQTFIVSAEQTDGCLQVGLKGVYKLRIEETILRLFNNDTDKEVTYWPLRELKNYGFSSHLFFFQAGTRCKTGAGKYIFHTCEGERIVECLTRESERFRGNVALIKALSVKAESFAISSTKPKPPAPPNKPKSVNVRNGSNQNEQRRPSCPEAEDRSSKKMSPAFGVPVFAALTNATSISRISDCSTPVAGNGSEDKERSNSLDGSVAKSDEKQQTVARSVSSQSSETISKKDSKKMQKEFKKEQKKREEEEKKERKRMEEERKKEKKKMEEEEKKLKKEQKKSKQKASKTLSSSSQSAPTASQQVNMGENADAIDSPYAEVEPLNHIIQPNVKQEVANSEKIYSEPWGNLPWGNLPVASGGVGDDEAVEYAQPQKLITKITSIEPREIVHTENYEECQAVPLQDDAPEIISPNWEQDEENASKNVYAHLKQTVPNEGVRENVYGMASASNPLTFTEEENPYEETNISAYECVG